MVLLSDFGALGFFFNRFDKDPAVEFLGRLEAKKIRRTVGARSMLLLGNVHAVRVLENPGRRR